MPNYPGAKAGGSATIYGPLPTHGQEEVAIVLHTTETSGMPGFGGGDNAPHYVYKPATREWFMWAEFEDGYVGTMRGHSSGGHTNCKAFQVEIICYSDKNIADQHSARIWVGDLTNENIGDLAEFVAWARSRYGIGNDVTPTPDGGWLYGTGSQYRLNEPAWDNLSGLTAHGAVPFQSHWDTGVLDLQYISDLAGGEDMFTHFEIGTEYAEWEPVVWLLFQLEGGTVNPNDNSSQVSDVLSWKQNVRLVQAEDLDLIGILTNMSEATLSRFKGDGVYRWGKEIAALEQYAWGNPTI